MTIREALDRDVLAWNLLEHPFYQAWSAGTLPPEALAAYAREYGAFVGTLPAGWTTLKDAATAQEEEEHAHLWDTFARALSTEVSQATVPQVRALMALTARHFAEPAAAAGALYAFERQQPATATSKLAGLRAFYRLGPEAERYFDEHTRNQHEADKLAARIESLAPEEQLRARAACRETSRALWDALSGLHSDTCPAA